VHIVRLGGPYPLEWEAVSEGYWGRALRVSAGKDRAMVPQETRAGWIINGKGYPVGAGGGSVLIFAGKVLVDMTG